MQYTLGQIIKDCQLSCNVLNKILEKKRNVDELLITDSIDKLVLYKMQDVLKTLNLTFDGEYLK